MAGAPPMPDESQHLPPPATAVVGEDVGATAGAGVAVGALVGGTAGSGVGGGVGGAVVGEQENSVISSAP